MTGRATLAPAGVALAGAAAAAVLLATVEMAPLRGDHPLGHAAIAVVLAVLALRIRRAEPGNGVAPVLAAAGACAGGLVAGETWARTELVGAAWGAWIASWAWAPALVLPHSVGLLLFPDGRAPSRWWRAVTRAAAGLVAAFVVVLMVVPGPLDGAPEHENPLGLPAGTAPVVDALVLVLAVLLVVTVALAAASLVARWRRSEGVLRRQLAWPALAGLAGLVFFLTTDLIPADVRWVLSQAVPLLVPAAVTAAVLRHGLYRVDRVLSRAIVYGLLTGLVFTAFAAAAVASGALLGGGPALLPALTVTAVLTVVVEPVRRRVQRLVDRAVYGRDGDPLRTVTGLGERLEGMVGPEEVPGAIVGAIADALGTPDVAVQVLEEERPVTLAARGEVPAADGPGVLVVPVPLPGGPSARIVVGPRRPGEALTRRDVATVRQLARQAGPAVHAALLAAEVRRARTRLVLARDEERRRLRRDLHDGLGPYLAGVSMGLEGVRRSLPEGAGASALGRIGDQVAGAVREVRRLVDDLRPGPLEELGLLAALSDAAERLGSGGHLRVEVDVPAAVPHLPAAVEVAAYRIATEALTNVARHAGARRCAVRLGVVDGWLRVVVEDDGRGLPAVVRPGVGLESMRERAEELCGRLHVGAAARGGTRVEAMLPLEPALPAGRSR